MGTDKRMVDGVVWNFLGFMLPRDGYGYGTIKIAEALGRVDPGCHVIGLEDERDYYGAAAARSWWLNGRSVLLAVPDFLAQVDSADGVISYTMFEATRLPARWVELLNERALAVIVPCRWCAEVFRANGVRRPICVVKWGVDGGDYPLDGGRGGRSGRGGLRGRDDEHGRARMGTDDERPYTFLWSGTPDKRKGWDLAYRCFVKAFGKREDVRLVLHFRALPRGLQGVRDANVTLVTGLHQQETLRSMLRRADCFVFPSRGEGWGSPPREAAATGLPVIATNWGGLAEEIEEWALPLRVAGMSKAEYGFWGDEIGEWAEPDPEHLVELLRWCAAEREQAAAFGLRAGRWLAQHAGWERTARGVCEVVR
ncbi:MAG: glycosyltransferase [Candidatus Kaiserbacteria bacterium]|nr:glycosyltransferase [Candidatus Kaiserbacteria bacterium]